MKDDRFAPTPAHQPRPLVLASSSPYRRDLLNRLGIAFTTAAPVVDETPLPGEAPLALVRRLAEAKARAVAAVDPGALVIGSDQAALLDDAILGKPGDHDAAVRQLLAASGRTVQFLTGVCLLDAAAGRARIAVVPYAVRFRPLARDTIEGYLRRERPYDCAGAFKSEGLGIALIDRMEGEDPTALIGLPLIRLVKMLEEAGVRVV